MNKEGIETPVAQTTPANGAGDTETVSTGGKSVLSPAMRMGQKVLEWLERIIVKYSPHGNATFFPPEDFPWAKNIEANWELVRKELDAVLEHRDELPSFHEISTDQVSITQDDKWKTFFLYGYGYKSEPNCAKCPETTRLIEQVPGMLTAFFSILSPGKHIPPHRGPYKGVLRYHLGVKVPEPDKCTIRVGDDYANWAEGKGMFFDDTHEHEVWHKGQDLRVVLFMDVVRPLRFPASWLNKSLIAAIKYSPLVQNARKNEAKWEMSFEDVMKKMG